MPLIIIPGSATANSYGSRDFADDYFATTSRAAEWALVKNQDGALLDGMIFIEDRPYIGVRATKDQALQFPRYGGPVLDPCHITSVDSLRDLRSREWPSDAIPIPIIQAQCEMALVVGQDEGWLRGQQDDVKQIRTGKVTIELGGQPDGQSRKLPTPVLLLLKPFLLNFGSSGRTMRA